MSININLSNQSIIPVRFGEFDFNVDISDAGKQKLMGLIEEFENRNTDIGEVKDKESFVKAIEETKSILKSIYDPLFGEGSFDKIYEKYPDVTLLSNSFIDVADSVMVEYEKRTRREQKDKYVANLKK